MSAVSEKWARGTIQNLHRLLSSETGNPRYGFHLAAEAGPDLDVISASNVGWAYGVTPDWEGQRVEVVYTEPANHAKPRIAQRAHLLPETGDWV
jgi:hypothetical protein